MALIRYLQLLALIITIFMPLSMPLAFKWYLANYCLSRTYPIGQISFSIFNCASFFSLITSISSGVQLSLALKSWLLLNCLRNLYNAESDIWYYLTISLACFLLLYKLTICFLNSSAYVEIVKPLFYILTCLHKNCLIYCSLSKFHQIICTYSYPPIQI